ncbi:UDP binding domain-containing protein [Oscillatoria amoena NRMC-F 0135]|nr:UDP binding domain-containing protein [Oscillatoria amoena NRMC-F 0135]
MPKILILGITFKENCPDVRNTRVVDLVKELKDFSTDVSIYDPWAEPAEVMHEYGVETMKELNTNGQTYDAVVLAVAHKEFANLNLDALRKSESVIFDIKGVLDRNIVDGRL